MNRKDFLKSTILLGISGAGISAVLSACGGKEKEPASGGGTAAKANDPCNDLSGLTDDEKETRTTFEYVAQSPKPDQHCSNCSLFIEPEAGKTCGTCQIVKGPINPLGHCSQWIEAPKKNG